MIRISRLFESPDPRFSVQDGWSHANTLIPNSETSLGLAAQGGHQHLLVTGNQLQTIGVKEWYDWYNIAPVTAMSYNLKVVTLTAANSGFPVGGTITVAGVNAGFTVTNIDGDWTCDAGTDSTKVVFTVTNQPTGTTPQTITVGTITRISSKIPYNALTYKKTATAGFIDEAAAKAWILANSGKTYIINNEPDGGYDIGGTNMSEEASADFHHTAAHMIRDADEGNDSTAFIVSAAWAGGIAQWNRVGGVWTHQPDAHNEDDFLSYHYTNYGTLVANALGLHAYQNVEYNLPGILYRINTFCEYAQDWKRKGWTSTDKVIITELGWQVGTVTETADNCLAFMNWIVPQLKANPQILRWHWWIAGGAGSALTDGTGNTPTTLGARYSVLALNS